MKKSNDGPYGWISGPLAWLLGIIVIGAVFLPIEAGRSKDRRAGEDGRVTHLRDLRPFEVMVLTAFVMICIFALIQTV